MFFFFFFFHHWLLYTVLPDLGLSLVAIIPVFLNADTCHKSHLPHPPWQTVQIVCATKGALRISQALLSRYMPNKLFLLQSICGFACECKFSGVNVPILQHFNSVSKLRSEALLSRACGLKSWCFCIRFAEKLSGAPGAQSTFCQTIRTESLTWRHFWILHSINWSFSWWSVRWV